MRRNKDERGAVAIMVSLVAVILFVVAALVVDLGLARDTKRQSQNASDAAALAAGNKLYTAAGIADFTTAVDEAKSYALSNYGLAVTAWSGCTDPGALPHKPDVAVNNNQCISFDAATNPTQVRVKIPLRDLKTGLGTLAGVSTIRIDSSARAAIVAARRTECSLCVLGTGTHAIGNGDITLLRVAGGIHMNGSLAGQGNSNVTSPGGTITIEGSFGGSDFTPEPTNAPRIGDPFANVTYPSDATLAGLTAKTDPCGATGGRGVYGSFEVGNGQTCTLSAGLYVFTGTLSLKNTSQLRGSGVTLLFACKTGATARACNTAGEAGGVFDAKNGDVQIQAAAAEFPGVVVAYDRKNTSDITLQGNGSSVLTGNVYAPSSLIYANGNSCHTVTGGSVVVNDIYMNGNNSCLQIQDGAPAVYVEPATGLHLNE